MVCLGRCSLIFKIASIVLIIGFILNAIGFAAPFWSNRTGDFEGLWQICSGGVCVNTVLNPLTSDDWFIANQALQAIGIILAFLAVVLALIFLCSACILPCFNACGIVIAIHVFVAAIALIAGLSLYAIQVTILNSTVVFFFSFWLILAAAATYLFAGILFSIAIDRDWKHCD